MFRFDIKQQTRKSSGESQIQLGSSYFRVVFPTSSHFRRSKMAVYHHVINIDSKINSTTQNCNKV